MHEIKHALLHSLEHTVELLPILFLAYLLMEYLEHHAGGKLNRCLQRNRNAGPLFGSLLGLLPQCGFSGAAASFFAGGAISVGTLLAVFLSTSDEMLPIMISNKISGNTILLVLGLKLLTGLVVGFLVDFVVRKRHMGREREIHDFCAQEHCSCEGGIFRSALRHTVQIALMIYVVTVALHLAFEFLPQEQIMAVWHVPVLSELIAALIGLVPNCAASVMITNLYVEGVMGIGPMMAGLLVNAGVGLLVLIRVNKDKWENAAIVSLLLSTGVLFGILYGAIFG